MRGSLFLLALGKSPLEFYSLVYRGGFGTAFSIQNTLQRAAPLILTAFLVTAPAILLLRRPRGSASPGAAEAH